MKKNGRSTNLNRGLTFGEPKQHWQITVLRPERDCASKTQTAEFARPRFARAIVKPAQQSAEAKSAKEGKTAISIR